MKRKNDLTKRKPTKQEIRDAEELARKVKGALVLFRGIKDAK